MMEGKQNGQGKGVLRVVCGMKRSCAVSDGGNRGGKTRWARAIVRCVCTPRSAPKGNVVVLCQMDGIFEAFDISNFFVFVYSAGD